MILLSYILLFSVILNVWLFCKLRRGERDTLNYYRGMTKFNQQRDILYKVLTKEYGVKKKLNVIIAENSNE